MRTKALLAAAAILAAGLASSMAQSNVYSLNVVGYVNVVLQGGGSFNFICNPLKNSNNSLTNLFKPGAGMAGQDGSSILTWDVNTYDFSGTIPSYSTDINNWSLNPTLAPGQGFFYVNNGANLTNTFVGEVIQGSFTNVIVGGGSFNAIGSSVPLGGSFTNSIGGITPVDGDSILKWDIATYDFSTTVPSYSTDINAWAGTVNIGVAEGVFYVRNGATISPWIRNFTVQ